MKRILAVTLLLMSFASVALADGSGLPPVQTDEAAHRRGRRLADGSGLPPVKPTKPPKRTCRLSQLPSKTGGRCGKLLPAYEPFPEVHPARAAGAVVVVLLRRRAYKVSRGFSPTWHSLWPRTWRGSLVHNHRASLLRNLLDHRGRLRSPWNSRDVRSASHGSREPDPRLVGSPHLSGCPDRWHWHELGPRRRCPVAA